MLLPLLFPLQSLGCVYLAIALYEENIRVLTGFLSILNKKEKNNFSYY